VEWHQDFAFYPHTNDDLLAVGIAIDDMMMENGPLLVVPGSHKGPIYSHHQDGIFVGAVTDADFSLDETVPLELKAGDISLHHARILHASAPNVSNRPRRFLLFQYCAVDAWPLLGAPNWQAFNADILRGEPTYAPRLTPIPVRIPLPTGERGGSIYEVQTMLKKAVMANVR
jgi:ectoine hydroxylase-related dioxygenase (phytanoyl-CoA dioxygenase family)